MPLALPLPLLQQLRMLLRGLLLGLLLTSAIVLTLRRPTFRYEWTWPRRTAAEFFEWDPDDEHGNGVTKVAGIEAAMWCETIATREELEFMLLPRLPGVAAIAWSPPQSTTWEQHRAALAAHTNVWAAREWTWFAHALR